MALVVPTEEAKLVGHDVVAGDNHGWAVAVSEDLALVSSPNDDDNGTESGSVYIFRGSGGVWTEEAKLTASDGSPGDNLGTSVGADGDLIVIGSSGDDDGVSNSGAIYVFRGVGGGQWVQEAKLKSSDPSGNHRLGGTAVAVSGDLIVAGAPLDDDHGEGSGSVYIFRHTGGGVWVEEAKLTASDGVLDARFGWSLSVSGDAILVGAFRDDDNGFWSGSAYVFRRSGGVWVEEAKLTASDGAVNDFFGLSVSLSGNVALIGARTAHGDGPGSAYVFRESGGVWTEEAKLTASDAESGDFFGHSVALQGDVALVGAWLDDHIAVDAGSAYLFQWTGGAWTEEAKLTASDATSLDQFSRVMALSSDRAVMGAIQSGYVFSLGSDESVEIEVVGPGAVRCTERALVSVSILTTADFGALTVDHNTVRFEGAAETHVDRSTGAAQRHEKDVDGDGDLDLVFHFRFGETGLGCASTDGQVVGETFDGQPVHGTVALSIIG